MSESRNEFQSGQAACCLWLLVGFTGAVMVATGLVSWFDGDAGRLLTLTRVFSGTALAIASWRCGRVALDHVGKTPRPATNAPDHLASRAVPSEPGRAHGIQGDLYSVAIGPRTP